MSCVKVYFCSSDDIKTDPVVVIRRRFVKSVQTASAVLECVVSGLPSGEVCINFQANTADITALSCVDWAPSENIWSLTKQLTIPIVQQRNGNTFTCKVHRPFKSWTSNPTGNIFVIAPSSQRAEVYLVGPSLSSVRSETSVSLTCLVVGQSVKLFSIQWKENGIVHNPNGHEQEPRDHNNGTQSKESILKVSVRDWNAYAVFACEVKHLCSNYAQQKRISKTRDPKQPTVRILRPSDSDLSGLKNPSLLCMITGFFPSDISVLWQLNGTQLDASQFTNSPVVAHTSGGFAMHSALMLPASEWKDGTFSCVCAWYLVSAHLPSTSPGG
uniref:Ig-like domain-containing protein n=1 Tax=Cyprinus carpio TaxID=7962 RepID=A0A8C2DIQ2_CYPCA